MLGLTRWLGQPSATCRTPSRLRLEHLEARDVPATFTVTALGDSGAGTLREAVGFANDEVTNAGADIIRFDPTVFGNTISLSTVGDTSFGPSALAITSNVTIDGLTGYTSGSGVTIGRDSAVSNLRLFVVSAAGNLTLQGLTLSGGAAQGGNGGSGNAAGGGGAGMGGAIFSQGTLSIFQSLLTNNTATGGNGGNGTGTGISTGGSGGGTNGGAAGTPNAASGGFGGGGGGGGSFGGRGGNGGFGGGGGGRADQQGGLGGSGSGGFGGGASGSDWAMSGGGGAGMGGAVFNHGGTVTITNSTLAGNSAAGGVGGLANGQPAAPSGNGYGGGVFNLNGTLTVTSSTIAANTGDGVFVLAQNSSGGVGNANPATATFVNSILFGTTTGYDLDVETNPTSGGATATASSPNIIGTTYFYNSTTDTSGVIATDPALAALADNGGPTRTMAIATGSSAHDAGSNAGATGLTFDQRGFARIGGGTVDLGAFEVAPPVAVPNASYEATPDLDTWTVIAGPGAGSVTVVRTGGATDGAAYARLVLNTQNGTAGRVEFGPTLRSGTFALAAGQTVGLDFTPYQTADATFVRIFLYTDTGARVATLYDGTFNGRPGWLTTAATAPAAGNYYLEAQVGSFDETFGGALGAELYLDNVRGGVTAPLVADVTDVSPDPTNAAVSTLTVTFNRAIDPTTFTTADLFLSRGSALSTNLITGAVTITALNATTYVIGGLGGLTAGDGLYRFIVGTTGITTAGGVAGLGNGWESWTADLTPPAVTAATRGDATPTAAGSVTFTVTFGEPVTGVDASDFSLATTGDLSGASVTGVTGSGRTYTVTVATGTGSGTLRLDVNATGTGIVDAVGNPLAGGFTAGETYTLDRPVAITPPATEPPVEVSPTPVTSPVASVPTTFAVSAPAATAGGTQIKVFDPATGQNTRALVPFAGYTGAVDVTLADLTGDGVADVIVGAGVGGGPRVAVFDGATGTMIASFFAFGNGFTGGVDVAAGDVTGDGVADIVVAAGAGGGPHVKVFDGKTFAEVRSFFAYDPSYLGGVRVAAGDVDGDGKADIVTGTGPGVAARVKAFRGSDLSVAFDFLAYTPTFLGGVSLAVGDVNGDGFADIITGAGAGGGPNVKVFDGKDGTLRGSLMAFRQDFAGGVSVAATDADGDGKADIAVGAGPGGGPHVVIFDGETFAPLSSTYAFDQVLGGGVYVG